MMKSKKKKKNAPLTCDVICSKLYRDGENMLVSFCQTNTLYPEANSQKNKMNQSYFTKIQHSFIETALPKRHSATELMHALP